MAPDAVAAKSSSPNNWAAVSTGSTTAELFVRSISTSEGEGISRALAEGSSVATSSRAVLTPQIATDFFELFSNAVFTFCSPSDHL
jgi:hypothetical protein